MPDLHRSLEDLDGERWGAAPPGSTRLVAEVHRLRRRPVGELSVEDLRLLVGQGMALDRLVPLALGHLRADPLASGDLYPGDLLCALLRADPAFWHARADLAAELACVVDGLGDPPAEVAAAARWFRARAA
ncbi:hypothetical protein BJF78_31185 [Pseudonocardia sp. CNS-139]|nr:hypothetical protein BJF78_31185 [Pseudonocardia sp. CNS-139]